MYKRKKNQVKNIPVFNNKIKWLKGFSITNDDKIIVQN